MGQDEEAIVPHRLQDGIRNLLRLEQPVMGDQAAPPGCRGPACEC
jgi:hypothetical protein